MPHRPIERRLIDPLDESLQAVGDLRLETCECIRIPLQPQMLQVRRQDQLRLDQRKQQHRRNDGRNLFGEVAPGSLEEEQRDKRDHRRQRAEGHRRGDLVRPLDRSFERRHASLDLGVNVFARDNRVIHHNADDDDVAKQAHHVGGDAEPGHHQHATGKPDRNTDDDPERERRDAERARAQSAPAGCPAAAT